jgi:uncharacterized cupredoxin-like copper-binding protein
MRHVPRCLVVLVGCGAVVATALAGSSLAGVPSEKRTAVSTSIAVSLTEYTFTLSANSAPVGTVVFKVTNEGKAPHNFSIAGRTTPDLAPGASAILSVNFTTAGAQPYLCTLPGHAQAGMQGTFTIKGSSATVKPTAILTATEKEWRINLTTSTGAKVKSVRRGLIRFKVRNLGVLPHNFVIAKHQTILVKPGGRAVLNVSLKRGRYRYICSIAGHAAQGMKGVLVVT